MRHNEEGVTSHEDATDETRRDEHPVGGWFVQRDRTTMTTMCRTASTRPRRYRPLVGVGVTNAVILILVSVLCCGVPLVESSSSTSVSYTRVQTNGTLTSGSVQKDAYDYYDFVLSALMDVDVRLDVSSGDADLYITKPCSACGPPGDGAGEHDWASYHGSGADEVFIHRRDLTASNDVGATKTFRIAVHGWASHGSAYTLSVEAIANERAMDTAHKTALDAIFTKCCGSDECESWRSIRAGNDDLCHTTLARCDANNQTTTLNFQKNEMECALTTADFAPFANSLERLYFGDNDDDLSMVNGFSGILASLPSLTDFVVDGVDLQGEGLAGVCNHTNLVRLQATGCNITGSIPSCVMSMAALEDLSVAENELTGTVPDLVAGSRLRIIDVRSQKSSASLTGAFPSTFASLDALEYVQMSGLKLSGSLPDSFLGTSRIRYFDLHDNDFSGVLPTTLGAIPHMETLWLADNAFSGAVPPGIYDHPSRVEVNLNSNEITTLSVTSQYSNPGESLLYFLASDNRINEVGIPTVFTTMEHLRWLFLAGNELRGNILPSQPIPQWDDLLFIDVHDNDFTGALPGASYWGSIFRNVPYNRGYNFAGNAFDADSLVWLQDYGGGISTIPSDGNVYTPRTSDLGETSSGKKQVPKFFLGLVMTGMAFLSLFSAAALLHVVRSRHRRIQNSSFQTFIDEEYNHQAVSGQQRVEMAYRPGYN